MGLVWLDGENSGGVPILDWRIKMRITGSSSFTTVTTGITELPGLVDGLNLGVEYDFTVEARNEVGYSAPSEIVAILHAIPPSDLNAPLSTYVENRSVTISWDYPTDNGS